MEAQEQTISQMLGLEVVEDETPSVEELDPQEAAQVIQRQAQENNVLRAREQAAQEQHLQDSFNRALEQSNAWSADTASLLEEAHKALVSEIYNNGLFEAEAQGIENATERAAYAGKKASAMEQQLKAQREAHIGKLPKLPENDNPAGNGQAGNPGTPTPNAAAMLAGLREEFKNDPFIIEHIDTKGANLPAAHVPGFVAATRGLARSMRTARRKEEGADAPGPTGGSGGGAGVVTLESIRGARQRLREKSFAP